MNKRDLVRFVAEQAGLKQADAGEAVEAVFDGIRSALLQGERVTVSGFGSFSARERASRVGVNPRTCEPLLVCAGRVPKFKASAVLKDALQPIGGLEAAD